MTGVALPEHLIRGILPLVRAPQMALLCGGWGLTMPAFAPRHVSLPHALPLRHAE